MFDVEEGPMGDIKLSEVVFIHFHFLTSNPNKIEIFFKKSRM